MATTLTNFLGQNWLITPAVPLVGYLYQPAAFFDQTWSLVLTGIVEANLQGNETVSFLPSGLLYTSDFDSPPVGQGPLYWVLNQYDIQSIARARELLGVAPPPEPVELSEPLDHLPPCPCCGGRMIIIETFERWRQPRAPPHMPAPTGSVSS